MKLEAQKKLEGWMVRMSNGGGELTRGSAKSVFERKSARIIGLTKERIITGYGMGGQIMHPTYEEDSGFGGFFKSPETAAAYRRMKMYRFGVAPTRGANLIMTGELYDNMYLDIDDTGAEITSSYVGPSLHAAHVIRDYNTMNGNKAFVFFPSWVKAYLGEDITKTIINKIKGK